MIKLIKPWIFEIVVCSQKCGHQSDHKRLVILAVGGSLLALKVIKAESIQHISTTLEVSSSSWFGPQSGVDRHMPHYSHLFATFWLIHSQLCCILHAALLVFEMIKQPISRTCFVFHFIPYISPHSFRPPGAMRWACGTMRMCGKTKSRSSRKLGTRNGNLSDLPVWATSFEFRSASCAAGANFGWV